MSKTCRKTCRKTFEETKKQRLKNPFQHSLYKLNEVARRLESSLEDVRCIVRYKNGTGSKYDLRCCTSEDIHIYLRKAPEHIAWVLGFHVLYGIDGLSGDGVSAQTVSYLKKYYTPRIEKLIDECDRVSDLIRTNIRHEYAKFEYDESDVFELFNEALVITESILDDAGHARSHPFV